MYSFVSSQEHFTSNPEKGKPHGTRNVVTIRNGKGFKEHSDLGSNRKVTRKNRHTLTPKELKNIQKKNFIPRLWNCCSSSSSSSRRTSPRASLRASRASLRALSRKTRRNQRRH